MMFINKFLKKKDFNLGSKSQNHSSYIKIRCTPATIGPGSFTPNYFLSKPHPKYTTFSKTGRYKPNTCLEKIPNLHTKKSIEEGNRPPLINQVYRSEPSIGENLAENSYEKLLRF